VTPPPSFDRLAAVYRYLERVTFGGALHRCRTAMLPRLADRRRALVVGDGDGRFVTDLLKANPHVRIDSLDVSPRMVALARRRAALVPTAAGRVRVHVADARTDPFPGTGYDLIVTNFFLDCFPPAELAPLARRLADLCGPGAVWVDGDFRRPPGRWERPVADVLLAGMYAFFRATTRLPGRSLTDPAELMAGCGFVQAEEASSLRGFLSSRRWVRT
jgi:SAM-dependent methyltransferase